MTTVREIIFGESMDPFATWTAWDPTGGLNINLINFSGTMYEQVGDQVTIDITGVLSTLLSDGGLTAVLENLPIPAAAGSTYDGAVDIQNYSTMVSENGTVDINPGVSATNLVINPLSAFKDETVYTIKGTIVYTSV